MATAPPSASQTPALTAVAWSGRSSALTTAAITAGTPSRTDHTPIATGSAGVRSATVLATSASAAQAAASSSTTAGPKVAPASSRQRVAQQHRHRHRAHAARYRCDRCGHSQHGVEVHVSHEAALVARLGGLEAVHADVDDHRARLYVLARDHPRAPDGDDQHVGAR